MLYLYPAFAAQIVRSLTLKAILTPVIVDRPTSGFAPISRPVLERAAGFTTLTLLPHAGRHTMAFIERLAASLPGLRLELGSDLAAIPAKITGLLQHSRAELAALAQPAAQAPAKERPLVSVIVPVRNGASFLPGAVASIQAQNYPALEIIVVDDGSTDDIQDVVARLPAAIRYVRQEPSGPAAARNRGIREARGELIAFLDVDDLWPADNLNIMVDTMSASPKLDVVQGYAQIMRQMPGSGEYEFIGCPLEVFLDYLGGALYRRTAFDKVGLLDESLAYCEDVDWFFRARDCGLAIERLDQISLYVRRHQQNMTRDGKQQRFALLVLKKIMAQRRARALKAEPHRAGAQPAAPANPPCSLARPGTELACPCRARVRARCRAGPGRKPASSFRFATARVSSPKPLPPCWLRSARAMKFWPSTMARPMKRPSSSRASSIPRCVSFPPVAEASRRPATLDLWHREVRSSPFSIMTTCGPAGRHRALRAAFEQDETLEAAYGRIVRRYEPGAQMTAESRIEGHHAGWLVGSGLYRRGLLARAGGFAEDMAMGEDVDFYLRLMEAGMRSSLCEVPGLIRRHHDANVTNELDQAEFVAPEHPAAQAGPGEGFDGCPITRVRGNDGVSGSGSVSRSGASSAAWSLPGSSPGAISLSSTKQSGFTGTSWARSSVGQERLPTSAWNPSI